MTIKPLTQGDIDRLKETYGKHPTNLSLVEHFRPKLFNADAFLGDYFTKGFYYFDAHAIMADIEYWRLKPVTVKHDDNCFHAEGHEFHDEYMRLTIEQLQREIRRVYLKDFECKLQFDFFTDHVNDHVQNWHSDAQYALPGQNATINCFFDNTSEFLGGRFDMMAFDPEYLGKNALPGNFTSIYPQRCQIVIFNQNRNFLHKAIPSKTARRMVSYACEFAHINPILPNWQS